MFSKLVNTIFGMCVLYIVYTLGMQGYNYMTGSSSLVNIIGSISSALVLSVYVLYCIMSVFMNIKIDILLVLALAFIAVLVSTILTVLTNSIFYASAIIFILLIIVYLDVMKNIYSSLKVVK